MSRQMNDGLERESGKRLFLWCNRYGSFRYPCRRMGAVSLVGTMRQVSNVEDW